MRLLPDDFYRLTPREFQIMLRMEREVLHDRLEFEARKAMMREQATRAKRPKMSDLYKRPPADFDEEQFAQQVDNAKHAQEWLDQFDFKPKGGN